LKVQDILIFSSSFDAEHVKALSDIQLYQEVKPIVPNAKDLNEETGQTTGEVHRAN
jgi:hypothetical protein